MNNFNEVVNDLTKHFCKYGNKPTLNFENDIKSTCTSSNKVQLGDTLLEAHKLINGDRRNDYGTPEDSFQRVANYWNVYIQHLNADNPKQIPLLTTVDVANMMILFKLAREEHAHKHDNYVDICGYAALADSMCF